MNCNDTILSNFDTFMTDGVNYERFNILFCQIKSVFLPLNLYYFIQC